MSCIPRTDLAAERRRADLTLPGTENKKETFGNIEEETLFIKDDEAAAAIGKPIGTYTTLSFPALSQCDGGEKEVLTERLSAVLAATVSRLTDKRDPAEMTLLIVGLGNRSVTADAVGVLTGEKIRATAHIKEEEPALFGKLGCAALSVLLPGVLSQSGIEASDRIQALIPLLSPDAVIVFDALAARSFRRVGRTFQIADTGIEPGSGIGNRRKAVTKETLGVPVIAVGMPTITDTATLVRDILSSLPENTLSPETEKTIKDEEGSYVTPGECDLIAEALSSIASEAVNRTFGLCL